MGPTLLVAERFSADQETLAGRAPQTVDALDPGTTADLSWTRISEMNCDELVRLIQNAHLPFLSEEAGAHLHFQERQTLERLANLARRCCLKRMTLISTDPRGTRP